MRSVSFDYAPPKTTQTSLLASPIAQFLALSSLAMIIVIDLFLGGAGSFGLLFLCTIIMGMLFHPYRHSPLAKVLYFTAPSIYILPMIALVVVGLSINVTWFALFIIVGFTLLFFAIDPDPGGDAASSGSGNARYDLLALVVLLAVGLSFILQGGIANTGFEAVRGAIYSATWAMGLLHLERIHKYGSTFVRLASLAVYCLFMALFMTFAWDGFGRIVLLSYLLAPFLISARYGPIRVGAYALAAVAALLTFVGRVVRFGWSDGLAGIADDSGASHLAYSSELWQQGSVANSITSFGEQYLLFFLGWFPRNLWPSKPAGVNYSYVDVYIGRTGLSEEHSTAIGSFGELMFYSQSYWPFLLVIVVATLLLVRHYLVKLSGTYLAPSVAFDVWLLTYFWGGMASFAARAWFWIIPLVAYSLIFRHSKRTGSQEAVQLA